VSSTCGLTHIWPTTLSMSAVPDPGRLLYWCYVESHKGRSSGRYSSFYIQRIWCGWWNPLNCVRTCMPTTPRVLSTGRHRSLRSRVADCVAAVADWMRSNRLQLNASKTEVPCFSSIFGGTVVRLSPSTKSATHRSNGRWMRPSVTCQMRARSRYLHRR